MKKQLLTLALILGLAAATTASAHWNRGGGGYGGRGGYGTCWQTQGRMQGPMQGRMFQQLDQATQEKLQQFFKDTQPLHKEMAMKRAEKQALLRSDTPDAKAVAKVTGEMFDLRAALQQKAAQAGVDQYMGYGRMGFAGRGPGACIGPNINQDMGPGMGMMNSVPQQ